MKPAAILNLSAILLVSVPAFAEKAADKHATSKPPDIAELIPPKGAPSGADFAFVGNAVYANATAQQMAASLPGPHVAKNVVGGYSKNKRAYWACADIASSGTGAAHPIDGHASAVWEAAGDGWKLVAFSIVPTATSKQQQDANQHKLAPPKITPMNGAGDEYFLTVFDSVFKEHAADTVGSRKDAVMFGSAANERYVGSSAILKALGGWDLAFTIRDGIATGLGKGRLLWIAANMDARPATKGTAAATPYRVFLVYEGDGDGSYELVHASFAAMTPQGWSQHSE